MYSKLQIYFLCAFSGLLMVLLATNRLNAQVYPLDKVDSLKRALQLEKVDTSKANLYNDVSWVYVNKDNELARKYADSLYHFASTISYLPGIRRSAHVLGNLFLLPPLLEPDSSIHFFKIALEIARNEKNISNIARHAGGLAMAYNKVGNVSNAIEIMKEAADLAIAEKDTVLIIPVLYNYAGYLKKASRPTESAEILIKLLGYPLSNYYHSTIYVNICQRYLEANLPTRGLSYCREVISVVKPEEDQQNFYLARNTLVKYYHGEKQLDSAEYYLEEIIAGVTDKVTKINAHLNLLNMQMDRGDNTTAMESLMGIMPDVKKIDHPDVNFQANQLQADLNGKLGNYRKALIYYDKILTSENLEEPLRLKMLQNKLQIQARAGYPSDEEDLRQFVMIQDSLNELTQDDKFLEIKERYENDKLIATQKLLEKEAKVKNLELKQRNNVLTGLGILALGLFAGIFWIRREANKRKVLNNQLQLKNTEISNINIKISEQNEQITAQNIQISRLNQDINHRATNNLNNVIRLLNNQRKRAIAAGLDVSVANAVERQILAYTKLQSNLKTNLTEVNLRDYLNDFCASLREAFDTSGQPVIFDHNIAEVTVHPDFVAPLALIINELATNSLKYARREDGILKIALDTNLEEGGDMRVYYRDGGPLDGEIDPTVHSSGEGMELIKGFTWELEGEIIRYGDAEGFDYEAVFELTVG